MSSAQQQSPDLAVVGGGVIGLAVAWRAAQRGLRTVVLERGAIGSGASGVAAGMLAPSSEAAFGEQLLLALNLESAQRWPAFAAELAERSGADPGYRPCGTLLAARDADAAAALERELAFRESLGLTVERLLPSRARDLEPALAPTLRAAAAAPDDHAVDPRRVLPALAAALRAAGGELRESAEVTELDTSGDRATGVRLAGGERLAAGRSSSRRAPGRARSGAFRTTPGYPSVRSRASSCACATPPARACSDAYCGPRTSTSCRAATAATSSGRRSRSGGSTGPSRPARCTTSCATPSRCCPGSPSSSSRRPGRAAAGHARQRTGDRTQRAGRTALGHGPLPSRRPAGAAHRRLVVEGVTGAPPRADAALLAPGRFGAHARTEVPA